MRNNDMKERAVQAEENVREQSAVGCSASTDKRNALLTESQKSLRLARLAFEKGELTAAESHLSVAKGLGLPTRQVINWRARIAKKRGDHSAARALYEKQLAASEQPDNELRLRLGEACLRQGDGPAALVHAERVLKQDDADVEAHMLAAAAALSNGDVERVEAAHSALMALEPKEPHWVAKQVWLLTNIGAKARAVTLIRESVSCGVENFELFRRAPLLALPADLGERAAHWARLVSAEEPLPKQKAARRVLESYGTPEDLAAQPVADAGDASAASIYDWVADAPRDDELKRSPVVDRGHEDVVVGRAARPEAVVLVFTGLADRAMAPIVVFDRYLAALNVSSIYLRDPDRLLFNKGIASLAPDFEGTVDCLRKLIAESGTTRLMTIGTSAGGYAAMRYGLLLGAENIVCFSAPANLTADFLADDGRGRIVARRLQSLPPEALDIRPMIEAGQGKTNVHLVFGDKMLADCRHARYLDGMPGVTLHPLAGVDSHGSLEVLAREKRLMSFLAGTLFNSSRP